MIGTIIRRTLTAYGAVKVIEAVGVAVWDNLSPAQKAELIARFAEVKYTIEEKLQGASRQPTAAQTAAAVNEVTEDVKARIAELLNTASEKFTGAVDQLVTKAGEVAEQVTAANAAKANGNGKHAKTGAPTSD